MVVTALWEPCEYSFVFVTDSKANAAAWLRHIIVQIETQTGTKVKGLQTDRGREFLTESLTPWLKERGIVHRTSVAKTPQQNGKAERLNGVLLELTKSLLFQAKADENQKWLWCQAMLCANLLRNIRLNSKNFVPYQKYWGKHFNYGRLKAFGCKAYSWIHPTDREDKLAAASEVGMFVGYAADSAAYEILTSKTATTN